MKHYSLEDLKKLENNTDHIRNICIVAHVDHGKTSLADALLVSNGIVSNKMSGKIRYMDSRKDEQERGITMKSSSIALGHNFNDEEYLINLIDSPGHVDFTGEVSTAVRLCDGAIVVVDVIEGICSQTKATLKQTWLERIKPILVLNKIDRLIVEKKMDPLDAYLHLQQILEQINAFVGELFTTDHFIELSKTSAQKNNFEEENNVQQSYDWNVGLEDVDDSNLYFMPEKNNVVFASALDGWGFSINGFSKCIAKKLNISEKALNKTLWGDYYINAKQKMILKGAQSKAKKPLFVSMVLNNIWSIYDAILIRKDPEITNKILSTLEIKMSKRDLNNSDAKIKLQNIFNQWIPLSNNVLDSVCKLLPSPKDLTDERIERFMCSNLTRFDSLPEKTRLLKKAFKDCSSENDSPKIVCVSKMVPFEKKSLPEFRHRPLTIEEINSRREFLKNRNTENQITTEFNELVISSVEKTEDDQENIFIAFSRIFSGSIKKGDEVYVLGPKHNPHLVDKETIVIEGNINQLKNDQHVTKAKIEAIYLLMGRELEEIENASAGNIVGLKGFDNHILKTATISDNLFCPPFIDLHTSSHPILRVAVEPKNPIEMPMLMKGLKLLNQADPCVEIKQQNSGENIIITTGEVHLQRCIDDLIERYAKIQINVSDPIVPFRETIVPKPKIDMVNEAIVNNEKLNNEEIILSTQNKKINIKMKAVPLPNSVVKLLEKNSFLTKFILSRNEGSLEKATQNLFDDINNFKENLIETFQKENSDLWIKNVADLIWSIGSKACPTNILLNYDKNVKGKSFFDFNVENSSEKENFFNKYLSNFITGFQMASSSGPLCEEPMMGVCFIILNLDFVEEEEQNKDVLVDPYGPISGQIMSTVKDICKKSFQAQPQRLYSPTFSCTIQVSSNVLGRMYGVISRRHGKILSEEMQEGSQNFVVTAVLPVIESFHFANEIRKQTSGMAVPQLVFSHWEIIDIDPFWIPTTDEEYLHYGEKADSTNRAKKYVDSVRKRKGLPVDEKIVEHAEKQRTVSRKK